MSTTPKPTFAPGSGHAHSIPSGCPSTLAAAPNLLSHTRCPHLQPLDAVAYAGLERQGEEERLADPRPRPHGGAARALGGRTLEELHGSPAARTATAARPERTPPAVGESEGGGLRRRAGLGPRGGGAFYSNYKGGVGPGGRARGGRRLPPRTAWDAAGVWLKLGVARARPRACPPSAAPGWDPACQCAGKGGLDQRGRGPVRDRGRGSSRAQTDLARDGNGRRKGVRAEAGRALGQMAGPGSALSPKY